VIGGFTPGTHGVDALVVGCYGGECLKYVARVRAGFVPASRRSVYALLKPLVTNTCPFKNLPVTRSGRWGEGLTAGSNGRIRTTSDTSSFVGMRDGKDPRSVVRERLNL
jgi:hypothetical protein